MDPENEVQRVGAKARDLDNLGYPGGVETAQAGTRFDVMEGEHGANLHCIRAVASCSDFRSLGSPSQISFETTLVAADF